MTKKVLLIDGILLALSVALVFLQPSRAILGTLAGEKFHAGRPLSFFVRELNADPASKEAALKLLKSKDAVPILQELLRSNDSSLRLTAVELLEELGPDAHAAGPDLLKLLKDSDPLIPPVVAASIPKVGIPAAEAIPALVESLDGPAGVPAARAISTYKGAARETVPLMEKILLDPSRDIELRWNAARTIGKIGPDAVTAVPTLVSMLTEPEISIREHAAEALGDIGPTAVSSIPELIKLLNDENEKVRRDTVRSLGYMGAAAKDVAPQLVPLLMDKADIVKAAAESALKTIAPELLPQPAPEATSDAQTPAPSESPAEPPQPVESPAP